MIFHHSDLFGTLLLLIQTTYNQVKTQTLDPAKVAEAKAYAAKAQAAQAAGQQQGGPSPPPFTTTPQRHRTTRPRKYIPGIKDSYCDWEAVRCLRIHKTGLLCGRTMYYIYDTFKNMCELEYVNCVLAHEMWMVAHMGECVENSEFLHRVVLSTYMDREIFLDNVYVQSDLAL